MALEALGDKGGKKIRLTQANLLEISFIREIVVLIFQRTKKMQRIRSNGRLLGIDDIVKVGQGSLNEIHFKMTMNFHQPDHHHLAKLMIEGLFGRVLIAN